MCLSNRNNYWLSFLHTKFKLEIKPFCFIRPRCFKGQRVPIKEIIKRLPEIFGFFFHVKKIKNLKLNWCTSETWMELTYSTVDKLLIYIDKNPYIFEIGKYISNATRLLTCSAHVFMRLYSMMSLIVLASLMSEKTFSTFTPSTAGWRYSCCIPAHVVISIIFLLFFVFILTMQIYKFYFDSQNLFCYFAFWLSLRPFGSFCQDFNFRLSA